MLSAPYQHAGLDLFFHRAMGAIRYMQVEPLASVQIREMVLGSMLLELLRRSWFN
jgi:hypothetical protein